MDEKDYPSDITGGTVTCQTGHSWAIEGGVLAFSREDAPSDPWSKSFKDYDKFAANKRWAMSHFASDVAGIIDGIPRSSTGTYLDMCTGDGALLFSLLEKIDPAIPVVSVDMSLHAQKYNRRHLAETHGDRPVSFVSCDASRLPFKDGVFPCVVSFAIGNMLEKTPLGIREAQRVLQKGGVFLFDHDYIAEESQGFRIRKESLAKRGVEYPDYLGLERNFVALMRSVGFTEYSIEVMEEVIGDPDRDIESGPLFPYPNEPMTKLLVRAWN